MSDDPVMNYYDKKRAEALRLRPLVDAKKKEVQELGDRYTAANAELKKLERELELAEYVGD
jgi:hypothetical protein